MQGQLQGFLTETVRSALPPRHGSRVPPGRAAAVGLCWGGPRCHQPPREGTARVSSAAPSAPLKGEANEDFFPPISSVWTPVL